MNGQGEKNNFKKKKLQFIWKYFADIRETE
jgi:hypothetical protein